jgi:hypothetical protein
MKKLYFIAIYPPQHIIDEIKEFKLEFVSWRLMYHVSILLKTIVFTAFLTRFASDCDKLPSYVDKVGSFLNMVV